MSAKIRHLALYTENHDRMATFYQKVFGMKRITKSFNDPNRGHISDGIIGLAPISIRLLIGSANFENARRRDADPNRCTLAIGDSDGMSGPQEHGSGPSVGTRASLHCGSRQAAVRKEQESGPVFGPEESGADGPQFGI
jgi:catechol 2,3-dioxygenase-like lactoylglutathione lyase family enzyme